MRRIQLSAFVQCSQRAFASFGAILIGTVAIPCLANADDVDARSIVKNAAEAQQLTNWASWRVNTEIVVKKPNGDVEQRAETWIRRKGDQVDSQGQYLYVNRFQEKSHRFRSITDGEKFIQYTAKPPEKDLTESNRIDGSTSRDRESFLWRIVGVSHYGGFLDGYLGTLGHVQTAKWMLDHEPITYRGRENLGSVECEIVEATTPERSMQLWIAPSQGFTVQQLKFKSTVPKDPSVAQSKIGESITMDNVKVASFDDKYLVVAGRLTVENHYTHGSNDTTIYSSQRSDIQLNPSFEGTDAFKMSMPDKSVVFDWDRRSGVRYQWRDGQVVPAYSDFDMRATGLFGGSKTRLALILVNGMVVFVIGAYLALRHIKSYRNRQRLNR